MTNILDKILATKRDEVRRRSENQTAMQLERRLSQVPEPRDFFTPVATGGNIQLIAEIKKASPSAGIIRRDFSPVEIARAYAAGGATCLSVLTDERYFMGSLDDLQQVRDAVDLPLLRKDFVIDRYQLLEARVAGADAVLLIAECLDDCRLRALHNQTLELGMTPLVEIHDAENLPRVLEAGARLIGINNRNLRSFETRLEHTLELLPSIPTACTVVSESGIRTHADLQRLQQAGVQAVLVGEHLMSQADIERATRQLLGNELA